MDVSASGLRLELRRPFGITDGMTIQVALVSPGGQIVLPATVVWSKRAGYRRFELGATFGTMMEELRRKLGQVISATGNNYVVYDAAHTL
jgi:hypothetical protein